MRRFTCIVAVVALGITASVGSVTAADGEFDVAYSVTDAADGEWLQDRAEPAAADEPAGTWRPR